MIYTVCGKNKNGEVVNIFTDGRTYKRKSQAERWMAEMQEITESELFIVAKDDAAISDPIDAEIAELRKDRERLEWMININAIVKESYRGVWYCEFLKNGGCRAYGETTPRGAIDAAMKEMK